METVRDTICATLDEMRICNAYAQIAQQFIGQNSGVDMI